MNIPVKKKKCIAVKVIIRENLNVFYIFFDKTLVFPNTCSNCGNNNDVIFKEEGCMETLKILGLIDNIKRIFCIKCSKFTKNNNILVTS